MRNSRSGTERWSVWQPCSLQKSVGLLQDDISLVIEQGMIRVDLNCRIVRLVPSGTFGLRVWAEDLVEWPINYL